MSRKMREFRIALGNDEELSGSEADRQAFGGQRGDTVEARFRLNHKIT